MTGLILLVAVIGALAAWMIVACCFWWRQRPPREDRLRAVEKRSRELERECGLVFDPDGWLMPGYGPYDPRGQIVRFDGHGVLVVPAGWTVEYFNGGGGQPWLVRANSGMGPVSGATQGCRILTKGTLGWTIEHMKGSSVPF